MNEKIPFARSKSTMT